MLKHQARRNTGTYGLFLPVAMCGINLISTPTPGSYGVGVNTISIQAALQHPLSRGSVKITSASVFDPPLIDPGYLTQCAHLLTYTCMSSPP